MTPSKTSLISAVPGGSSSPRQISSLILAVPSYVVQILIGLTCSLPALRLVRGLISDSTSSTQSRGAGFGRCLIAWFIASVVTVLQVMPIVAVTFAIGLSLYVLLIPGAKIGPSFAEFMKSEESGPMITRTAIQSVILIVNIAIDGLFVNSFADISAGLSVLRFILRIRLMLTRALIRVGSTMILMGLSLLPLSSLLLALPMVNAGEAVLSDAVPQTRSFWSTLGRRIAALVTCSVTIFSLVAFATELVSLFGLPGGTYYGTLLRTLLPPKLLDRLPNAMVDHWPYILMAIYVIDLGILVVIGKVPLQYNLRNLVVRWPITAMTAVAFVVVVGMLTVMLAFVTGMSKTTADSGFPGNVMVLSDGATDELFSNLGYGNDIDNLERIVATADEHDHPLARPIKVKQEKNSSGTKVYWSSRETYCVINQQIPNSNRRRFVQLRIVVDADVSAGVHNLSLATGRWFTREADSEGAVPCVLGEGVAGTLGEDLHKKRMDPGDTFELGDMTWVVVGIMKTEGTTFGSEIWCSNASNKVTKTFGKENHTTLVMRVNDDSEASARAFAYHIRNRYQTQKLKAVVETEYFADLNKSNQQFLQSVIVIAIVMAIGGVFCVMITMFSAIAQRTKDIGILRLLGFKRWQVLISFLLESMGIALIGGLAGLAAGAICDGFSVTSIASSGQGGGGKSVAARLVVNRDVVLVGLLFTLVMGRLGGLVPALSAMRLKILESLR